MFGLPFGGFFLKLIGGEIIKTIFNSQVPTTVVTPNGVDVGLQHWSASKTIWGGIAVLGYVGVSIFTGNPLNLQDVNTLISDGGNLFLTAAAVLSIIGRKRL